MCVLGRHGGEGGGGWDKIMYNIILYDIMQIVLLLFSVGEGCFLYSMHPEEYPPQKTCE